MIAHVHHADCLEHLASMPEASVDAIVTDPPYGLNYRSNWGGRYEFAVIQNDEAPFIDWIPHAARVMRDGAALFCFCAWQTAEAFRHAIARELKLRGQFVWDRRAHGMGDLKGGLAPQHDLGWFATKGDFTWPDRRLPSVLRSARACGDTLVHPTQKPVEVLIEILRHLPEGHILDPFLGSGSTGVAAMLRGCSAFTGIEIDRDYAELAYRRIAEANPLFATTVYHEAKEAKT